MSWPAFTTFPGLKDSLIRFLLARLYFASSSTIARRERKHLSILFLDRSLLPLGLARFGSEPASRPSLTSLPAFYSDRRMLNLHEPS